MRITIELTRRQISDLRAQLITGAEPATRKPQSYLSTDARRAYMAELMRKRRAAQKAA